MGASVDADFHLMFTGSVADPRGDREGHGPLPGTVKISHKKMAAKGSRKSKDFMFLAPLSSAAGSATVSLAITITLFNLIILLPSSTIVAER